MVSARAMLAHAIKATATIKDFIDLNQIQSPAVHAENLNPNVAMMEPAQNWQRRYGSDRLGTSKIGRVLVE